MSRCIALCALVLLLLVPFAAFGGGEEEPDIDRLRVALPITDPDSLDASIASERNAQNVSWQMFDSLVYMNEDGLIEPALATDWDVSDDGTEYTFYLRDDVRFHNGEPFNAEAVRYSWERGSEPEMQWSDRWQRASEVEVVDEHTVIVRTEEPDPVLLSEMAVHWNMVPPEYAEEVGVDEFSRNPVGTGPFEFVEWVREDRIVMRRNENYWREGLPRVDEVIFRPIPENTTRTAAIQTGEIDIVNRLTYEQADSLEPNPDVNVISYPVDRVYYVAFNNLTTGVDTPVEDQRVRQAMNYAVDRQAIVDSLFGGHGELATGMMTSANLGYDDDLEPYAYDPDRARELLAEAGYPDGFEIGFAGPADAYTNFEEVLEAVQGYLADVGIQANLEFMESGRYWDLQAQKELPPLFADSWSERPPEALPRLLGALGGWDASFSAWEDAEIDRLLDEISVTVDETERAALYRELHHYMHENPPFIYLYVPMSFEATRSNVVDYNPRAAEDFYLMYTSIE